MIQKLVCCECIMELKHDSTEIDSQRKTIKYKYYCPRCKKCVEIWIT